MPLLIGFGSNSAYVFFLDGLSICRALLLVLVCWFLLAM